MGSGCGACAWGEGEAKEEGVHMECGGNTISGPLDSIAFHAKHVFHSASFSRHLLKYTDLHSGPAYMSSHEYTH